MVTEHGYTTRESGAGRGLFVVAEIAETYGWRMAVTDSETGGARIEFDGVDVLD